MALVDYSDSDESDIEDKALVKTNTNTTKPTVKKIVDRSNPGKIKVSLSQASYTKESTPDEPPAKRVKTGGSGLFRGLSSLLPPPKQTGVVGKGILSGSGARKGGLGAGVSLRTGAAPGFSREPEPPQEKELGPEDASHGNGPKLSSPTVADSPAKPEEIKLVGKPLMFKPLSVARKSGKKTKQQTTGSGSTSVPGKSKSTQPTSQVLEPPQKRAKLSLFSTETESPSAPSIPTTGNYQPLIHGAEVRPPESRAYYDAPSDPTPSLAGSPTSLPVSSVQSLDSIAQDLNLSEADRRQLFGRHKGGSKNHKNHSFQATKIVNFNTDQEYAHNEELRASGEEAVHNPVKSIAPGKHSLKQLVRVAQTQKEALEESFVKGKTNRAEASSRYGW